MKHRSSKKKLNLGGAHRAAFLRNQVILFIDHGSIKSTTANLKQARRLAEKLVTIAKRGNSFENRRKALSLLPYKTATLDKLFKDIAGRYMDRQGGYTRLIPMGIRPRDTAKISRLEWV